VLPVKLVDELLRLHGIGVELAESVFSSDDTGTFASHKPRFVMNSGAMVRPARFNGTDIKPNTHISILSQVEICSLGYKEQRGGGAVLWAASGAQAA